MQIDDFLNQIKFSEKYDDNDYREINHLIEFTKSISYLTYQSIYLIDYYKKGFLFVSNNPIFLCGKSPSKVLEDGYFHYFENVPEDDLKMLLEINDASHKFYESLPNEERLNYYISYNFHLKQPVGKPVLINHKLKPLLLDKNQNIWIAICFVSISSQKRSGNVTFKSHNSIVQYNYDFNDKKWEVIKFIELKKREKDILLYSAQGYTMEQIADWLFISVDTIKYYKRSIFNKLNVKSISEALIRALELDML
ncbi:MULTISPECIES: response regulator transcription factor [Sphingobacterium]|uniref:Helix-turn-helix transcriptional regulator n=1 Tax=Sphingobacterium tenebrionis TaxID=3111775 RepID=A0ABU8I9A9_9SPHI|nr:helix-turn-helix transcriptional regulator [Sphingobacterium sp. CZ-2]QBR11565.1 LuxR family transcriptional regulator [Sphingobacterium sp. CZ-2]